MPALFTAWCVVAVLLLLLFMFYFFIMYCDEVKPSISVPEAIASSIRGPLVSVMLTVKGFMYICYRLYGV